MTPPVFFIPADDAARLEPGSSYLLGGDEGRHAATVRRLQTAESVELSDGRGTRIAGTVQSAQLGALTIAVSQITNEPVPQPQLVLVQALAKDQKDVQAIEAAVECGVDAIIPWAAERSIVQWRGPKADKGRAKWENAVRAATKQARRVWLPAVMPVINSTHLAQRIGDLVRAEGAALVLHESAPKSLADARLLADFAAPDPAASTGGASRFPRPQPEPQPPRDLLVIVGPEGGIPDAELASFVRAGAQAVRLGPHIMRTSTAGPVAIAMLAQRLGRWDDPPSR